MVEQADDAWEAAEVRRNRTEAVRALKEVLTRLERLAVAVSQEVEALEERQPRNGNERQRVKLAKERVDVELEVGTRVRVIRRDQYYGRVGEVMGPHGRHYIDVRLTDRPSREVIYKRRDGLEVLKD